MSRETRKIQKELKVFGIEGEQDLFNSLNIIFPEDKEKIQLWVKLQIQIEKENCIRELGYNPSLKRFRK